MPYASRDTPSPTIMVRDKGCMRASSGCKDTDSAIPVPKDLQGEKSPLTDANRIENDTGVYLNEVLRGGRRRGLYITNRGEGGKRNGSTTSGSAVWKKRWRTPCSPWNRAFWHCLVMRSSRSKAAPPSRCAPAVLALRSVLAAKD